MSDKTHGIPIDKIADFLAPVANKMVEEVEMESKVDNDKLKKSGRKAGKKAGKAIVDGYVEGVKEEITSTAQTEIKSFNPIKINISDLIQFETDIGKSNDVKKIKDEIRKLVSDVVNAPINFTTNNQSKVIFDSINNNISTLDVKYKEAYNKLLKSMNEYNSDVENKVANPELIKSKSEVYSTFQDFTNVANEYSKSLELAKTLQSELLSKSKKSEKFEVFKDFNLGIEFDDVLNQIKTFYANLFKTSKEFKANAPSANLLKSFTDLSGVSKESIDVIVSETSDKSKKLADEIKGITSQINAGNLSEEEKNNLLTQQIEKIKEIKNLWLNISEIKGGVETLTGTSLASFQTNNKSDKAAINIATADSYANIESASVNSKTAKEAKKATIEAKNAKEAFDKGYASALQLVTLGEGNGLDNGLISQMQRLCIVTNQESENLKNVKSAWEENKTEDNKNAMIAQAEKLLTILKEVELLQNAIKTKAAHLSDVEKSGMKEETLNKLKDFNGSFNSKSSSSGFSGVVGSSVKSRTNINKEVTNILNEQIGTEALDNIISSWKPNSDAVIAAVTPVMEKLIGESKLIGKKSGEEFSDSFKLTLNDAFSNMPDVLESLANKNKPVINPEDILSKATSDELKNKFGELKQSLEITDRDVFTFNPNNEKEAIKYLETLRNMSAIIAEINKRKAEGQDINLPKGLKDFEFENGTINSKGKANVFFFSDIRSKTNGSYDTQINTLTKQIYSTLAEKFKWNDLQIDDKGTTLANIISSNKQIETNATEAADKIKELNKQLEKVKADNEQLTKENKELSTKRSIKKGQAKADTRVQALTQENETLKNQLAEAQSKITNTSTGSTGRKRYTLNPTQTKEAIKASTEVSKETNKSAIVEDNDLANLNKTVNSVTEAVNNKTQAFENEKVKVHEVAESEVADLTKVLEIVKNIKEVNDATQPFSAKSNGSNTNNNTSSNNSSSSSNSTSSKIDNIIKTKVETDEKLDSEKIKSDIENTLQNYIKALTSGEGQLTSTFITMNNKGAISGNIEYKLKDNEEKYRSYFKAVADEAEESGYKIEISQISLSNSIENTSKKLQAIKDKNVKLATDDTISLNNVATGASKLTNEAHTQEIQSDINKINDQIDSVRYKEDALSQEEIDNIRLSINELKNKIKLYKDIETAAVSSLRQRGTDSVIEQQKNKLSSVNADIQNNPKLNSNEELMKKYNEANQLLNGEYTGDEASDLKKKERLKEFLDLLDEISSKISQIKTESNIDNKKITFAAKWDEASIKLSNYIAKIELLGIKFDEVNNPEMFKDYSTLFNSLNEIKSSNDSQSLTTWKAQFSKFKETYKLQIDEQSKQAAQVEIKLENDLISLYSEKEKILEKISKAQFDLFKAQKEGATATESNEIKRIKELTDLQSEIDKSINEYEKNFGSQKGKNSKYFKDYKEKLESDLLSKQNDYSAKYTDKINKNNSPLNNIKEATNAISIIENTLKNIKSEKLDIKYNIDTESLNVQLEEIKPKLKSLNEITDKSSSEYRNNFNAIATEISNINKLIFPANVEIEKNTQVDNINRQYKLLINTMEKFKEKNSQLNSDEVFLNRYNNILNNLSVDKTNQSEAAIKRLRNEFTQLTTDLILAGKIGKSPLDKFKELFSKLFVRNIAYMGAGSIGMYLRQMITSVKEIDSAMTQLKKVTDETALTYNNFLKTAGDNAVKLGSTMTQVINSTAEFAKLGYNLRESTALAQNAIMYSNVGDLDITTATNDITSTLKAFNIEASNAISIVDKLNEVGNNYAISSSQIGAGLTRSASALALTGNSLDESIAMITSISELIQDSEKAATALKVTSLRLRGAKVELEKEGEETDGLVTSTSKLQAKIKALSGVDIMIDSENFKSTYQIMKEISAVYDDLKDIDKTALLELIAGRFYPNVQKCA